MSINVYNVLFVCTGNSARSIIGEGLLNSMGAGRFKAFSAGSMPTGKVNPLALAVLSQLQIPTNGFRSKSWEEYSSPEAPEMDFVFTVCDKAAGEVCPVWPGMPITAHWGVPDPAAVEGTDEQKAKAFAETVRILKRRLDYLMVLPLDRLDAMAIRREVAEIGKK